MKAQGVYAVVGMPYSGSTLLSFIVGSHEKVYNGADLHHLNPDRRGSCSIHKEKCKILDATSLEKIYNSFNDCDEWYDSIADATGRPFIFDASKQLSFFKRVLVETEKRTVVIALNKHPMRALASDIYNRLFDRQLKIKNLLEIRSYINNNKDEVETFLKKRIEAILKDVEERSDLLKSISERVNIVDIVNIKYEDYIEDPKAVVSQLLGYFDLDYREEFINYGNFEHHPITGNMAPIWKVREKEKNTKADEKNFRKNFYLKSSSSIVIDDKYKEIFSEAEIMWIENQLQYKKLLKILNYQPMKQASMWQRFKNSFM